MYGMYNSLSYQLQPVKLINGQQCAHLNRIALKLIKTIWWQRYQSSFTRYQALTELQQSSHCWALKPCRIYGYTQAVEIIAENMLGDVVEFFSSSRVDALPATTTTICLSIFVDLSSFQTTNNDSLYSRHPKKYDI